MSERSWHRWEPLSGAVFVVLFIVGFIVSGSSPSSDDPNEKIAAYLAKSSNQTKNIVAFFILLLAMLFLIWFYASLRARLAQAERGDHGLSSLAFGRRHRQRCLLGDGDQHLPVADHHRR